MRNLRELNINEGGELVTLPPPSPEQIALVEQAVGKCLPTSYVEFLRFSNGGHPELDTFRIESGGKQYEWGVDRFFHISDDLDSTEDVMWNYRNLPGDPPRTLLPIGCDGGGNLIFLDLSEDGDGRIFFWVHDDPNLPLLHVADSFEEFIDMLTLNPDYI
jgi:hypothetical protein